MAILATLLPAAALAAPPVLVVYRSNLVARYVDPALDPDQAKARKDALALEIAAETRQQAPDAIVLDRDSVVMGRPSADITPFIEQALDKTDKPFRPTMVPDYVNHSVTDMASRPFVLDRAALLRAMPPQDRTALEQRVGGVLQEIMAKDDVPLILDRNAIVLGEEGYDITQSVATRLKGGNIRIVFPLKGAAGILFLDRTHLLAASKVGQSINAQVGDLLSAAELEFQPESATLRADGEALKTKLPSLTPQEKSAEIQAFEARKNTFQEKVEDRQKAIQDAVLVVRHEVEAMLQPLLLNLMHQHSAALIVDKNAAVSFPADLDITTETIAALDAAMPDVALSLAPTQDHP